MAVLITTDNKKELYLVKEMIDTGLINIPNKRKKDLEKAGIPTSVNITYNLITPELVKKIEELRKNKEDESTIK